jgi:phosphoglycerate dehydrogenase-like enzyme
MSSVDRVVAPGELASVLPDADVVVLSAPATEETRGLVDATFLAHMRPGAILVNVARGELIDEEALLDALDSGTPAVAVLDAFAIEPLPISSRLWSHPRVVLTPHCSARGSGNADRAFSVFRENLARFRRGEVVEGIDTTWTTR